MMVAIAKVESLEGPRDPREQQQSHNLAAKRYGHRSRLGDVAGNLANITLPTKFEASLVVNFAKRHHVLQKQIQRSAALRRCGGGEVELWRKGGVNVKDGRVGVDQISLCKDTVGANASIEIGYAQGDPQQTQF